MSLDVIACYKQHAQQTGKLLCAPVPGHVCRRGCRMWEAPGPNKAFVCEYSHQVHWCGEKCQYAEETHEHYVCTLTGHLVPFAIEKNYVTLAKDTHSDRTYNNDHYIIMGKRGPKRKKNVVSSRVFNATLAKKFIVAVFDATIHATRSDTKFLDACKVVAGTNAKMLVFSELQKGIFYRWRRHSSFYQPKMPSVIQLERLTTAIAQYWHQLNATWTPSPKNMLTFTAVIISKLRTGYHINKIKVFPRVEWVAANAPPDIAFAGIMGIRCRAMSILWRQLQALIVDSASGQPVLSRVFSLDK
jgi:hypothetical protein